MSLAELMAAAGVAPKEVAPVVPIRSKATCPECGRIFDLTNEVDSDEWAHGHDCEVTVEVAPQQPEPTKPVSGADRPSFRVARAELKHALMNLKRIVATKTALPILQGIMVTVEERGRVSLEATDLDFYAQVWINAADSTEGRVVIPAGVWKDVVGASKTAFSTVKVEEAGEVTIDDWTTVRSFSVNDYPKVDTFYKVNDRRFSMAGRHLDQVLACCVAASKDEARPVLTGIFVDEEDGKVRWVATDSYRLAVADTDLRGDRGSGAFGLVPAGIFKLWKQLWGAKKLGEGTQTLMFGEHHAMLARGNWLVGARLIDGSFPNYRQLIPKQYPNRLTVDSEEMMRALKVLRTIAADHVPIRLDVEAETAPLLRAVRQDVGESDQIIGGVYEGETMTVAFNTKYLTDGLMAAGLGKVTIELLDPLKPGIIRGAADPGFLYLQMPVRL